MNLSQSIRSLPRVALVAFALSGFALISSAQPTPAKTTASPSPAPVGPNVSGLTITASGMPAPMFQGVISADESKAYMAFQQQINEDPAIKELNAKIMKLTKELQQLRAETNATREKLIAANPEMQKIQEKIMTAMHSRTNGPMPMPMPLPSKSN